MGRDCRVEIRLTADELDVLRAAATRIGLSLSAFLRMAALNAALEVSARE